MQRQNDYDLNKRYRKMIVWQYNKQAMKNSGAAIIMSAYTKPLYKVEKELQYRRHLSRLQSINLKARRQRTSRNTLQQMHRIRDQSLLHRQRSTIESINHQNSKILNRLLDISRRKGDHTAPSLSYSPLQHFQNPLRKRQRRQIQISNIELADRLMAKHSSFDRNSTRKSIQKYQAIKRMLQHNKMQHISLPKVNDMFQDKLQTSERQHSVRSQFSLTNPNDQ